MNPIDNFRALLAKGMDTPLLRFSLGQALFKQGDRGEAVEHLRAAVTQDPKYSAAWKILGKALGENGQPEAAMVAYRQGIAVAEEKGDIQAAKEMRVFLRRLEKAR